jgi:hypothetical protein
LDTLLRRYAYCRKYLIYVPRGQDWSTWNWMLREREGEEYQKDLERDIKIEELLDRQAEEEIEIAKEEEAEKKQQKLSRQQEEQLQEIERKLKEGKQRLEGTEVRRRKS